MRLFAAIHNLSEMAPRPVLLAMLVEQVGDLEKMQAQTGRALAAVDIYDRMVERWLERDDPKHKLEPDHKRRIMEGLAAFLWEEGLKQVDIERLDSWFVLSLARNEDIRTCIEFDKLSTNVLKGDLRTCTFLVRPDAEAKHFRFAHTSFQEYFLARYLVPRSLGRPTGGAGPCRWCPWKRSISLGSCCTGTRGKRLWPPWPRSWAATIPGLCCWPSITGSWP